jgi:hypothetical protein
MQGDPWAKKGGQMAPLDLARCFTTDGWLADANGDGLADRVDVRIVLPNDVSAEEAAAAAELAARLGHGTMALDLPLVYLAGDEPGWTGRTITLVTGPAAGPEDAGRVQVDEEGQVTIAGPDAAARALALRFLARWAPRLPGNQDLGWITTTLEERGRAHGCPVRVEVTGLSVGEWDPWHPYGPVVLEVETLIRSERDHLETVRTVLGGTYLSWPGTCPVRSRVRFENAEMIVHWRLGYDAPLVISEPDPRRDLPRAAAALDLARLFDEDGLLVDRDGDLFADDVRATLAHIAGCGPRERAAAANLAARLGLEATGLTLPLAGPHSVWIGAAPRGEPASVRIGRDDDGTDHLIVSGAAAAEWLANGAPGPSDGDDPLVAARARVLAALQGTDRPVPPRRVVWRDKWTLPWEVDDARRMLDETALPRVRAGLVIGLDLTLSEPRAVRERLRDELTRAIEARGGLPEVVVRCAHKPGLSWLTEEVAPRLAALPTLDRVVIRVREFRRQPGQEWLSPLLIREYALVDPAGAAELEERIKTRPPGERWLDPPSRWLLELYPADELLPLSRERVELELVEAQDQDQIYRLLAYDAAGRVLLETGFDPAWRERLYLDAYPELGRVHPTTGWVRAEVDGVVVVDEWLPTDLERIWERYQGEILPRLAESVRELAGGSGESMIARQPFFCALEIDATLSEPDERLGVREERLSGLEVLHEELYFVTLEFLKELGRREAGAALEAPGGVVPWVHDGAGGPPRLTWTLTAFDGLLPAADPVLPVGKAERAVRVVGVTLGLDGTPDRIEIAVALEDPGRLEEARERLASALDPDREPGLETPVSGKEALPGLRTGVPVPTTVVLECADGSRESVVLGVTERPEPLASIAPLELARDRVIGHAAHMGILAGLRERPEVSVWEAGRSFEGRSIWCVEATLPNGGERTSAAKQAAWKPTLLLIARHHGNEPSSTTASLALVDRLSGTPEGREVLAKLNLAVIPYENPDGAELADRMQAEHPGWMLHAGRFNAFGLEFHRAYGKPASPALEARVRPLVWRRWRPDAFVDDHGFPSHEWCQPFSGYIPLYPSYWLARGLAYAYLRHVDEPDYPEHRGVAEWLRDLMAEEVAADPEVWAWNRTWAERYATYGNRRDPQLFPVAAYRDMVCYLNPTKVDSTADIADPRHDYCTIFPAVTAFALVTEIADETAQGPYMDLCVRAHEAIDWAAVRLLTEGDARFEGRVVEEDGAVRRWLGRRRPVGVRP